MFKVVIFVALVGCLQALSVPMNRNCALEQKNSGLTRDYYENIAHTVHSMTVRGLQMFNPRAGSKNFIPTVNSNISAPNKVVYHAPEDPLPTGYATPAMRTLDKILSHVGVSDDGLGPNWSPVERVAHVFHMLDLWERVRQEFDASVLYDLPSNDVCACLTDVTNNGVEAGVSWVANHYKSGTPITLLGRPIPKLTDAKAWGVWKQRLLYYYTKPALHDAAVYMYCATKDF